MCNFDSQRINTNLVFQSSIHKQQNFFKNIRNGVKFVSREGVILRSRIESFDNGSEKGEQDLSTFIFSLYLY